MERPIERTDDQAGAAGALADPARVGGIDRFFLGEETLRIGDGEINFGDEGGGLGPAFGDGFADFPANALGQFFLMGLQNFLRGTQPLDPFRKGCLRPAFRGRRRRGQHRFRGSGMHFRQQIGEVRRIGVPPGFGVSGHGHRVRP